MKTTRTILVALLTAGLVSFTACGENGTEAGDADEVEVEVEGDLEEGIEAAGDAIEDGAEAVGDAIEEGAEAVEEAVDSL